MPNHLRLVGLLGALLLLMCTSADVRAGAEPQSEKCDDLQTRCLHRENAICQIWQQECVAHQNHATHGHRRPHNRTGRKPRV